MENKDTENNKEEELDKDVQVDEETLNEKAENTETEPEETEENKENKEEAPELTEEEKLQNKMADLNDKYLRLYSDFENFRKRTIKEKGDLIANASEGVIKDMLPIMDDFERAIENNQTSEDAESIKQGFQLIYNKFSNILKSKGLSPMDSKGEVFDIDHHEAVTNIPADKKEKGKVVDVIEKGYYLNDKVLRYAKVVVGQ